MEDGFVESLVAGKISRISANNSSRLGPVSQSGITWFENAVTYILK